MKPGPATSTRCEVRGRIGLERGGDLGRDVARRPPRGLRHLQRDVRRPVAVLGLLRSLEDDALVGCLESGGRQRAAEMECELVTHRRRCERTGRCSQTQDRLTPSSRIDGALGSTGLPD